MKNAATGNSTTELAVFYDSKWEQAATIRKSWANQKKKINK